MNQHVHHPARTRRLVRLVAGLLALGLVAAACGDDDDDATTPATGETTAPSGDTTAATTAGPGDTTTSGDSTESTEPPPDATTTVPAPVGDPEEVDGFDGETITVGAVLDQTGPLAFVGTDLLVGAQTYWDFVNEELGGIAGKYKVEIKVADSKNEAPVAVQAYQQIKGDVVMFTNILGTPVTKAMAEFLVEDNILAIPGSLAGEWVRNPNFLPYSAPYEIEMINGVEFWQTNLEGAGQTACTFAQNDSYGESGLTGLEFAAEKYGFEFAADTTYNSGDTDFTAQVTELADAGCEVVFSVSTPREQTGLMTGARSLGFEPVFIGTLPSFLSLLAGGDNGAAFANFYLVGDGGEFGDPEIPGMKNFLDRVEKYGDGAAPSTFLLTGYTATLAAHAALEKAVALGDLSHEGLVNAVQQLGEVDFEGLAGNYTYGPPDERVPPIESAIFRFDPAKTDRNLLALQEVVESPFAKEYVFAG